MRKRVTAKVISCEFDDDEFASQDVVFLVRRDDGQDQLIVVPIARMSEAMPSKNGLAVGDVIDLGGRKVRVIGKPDGVSMFMDHRGRIAVRNVETHRLSYIPKLRLLAARRRPARQARP